MQQHPVPQNISSFEFKLIGFLTIKQFAYLSVAGFISFLFFISPINFLVRIILILPFAGLGLLFAFVPINGVPFDKWIVIFTRSIYSPSRRTWHKTPKEISFLSPWFSSYLKRPVTPKPRPDAGDRSKLENYLAQLRKSNKSSHLDDFEERRLSTLNFSTTVPNIKSLDFNRNAYPHPPKKEVEVGVSQPLAAGITPPTETEEPPWLK